ncbi:MAG: hypothetical protein N2662_02845, partial [Bacteroidales bacterium]|nr:hypothetical protein [Bacteroidales bacterium]
EYARIDEAFYREKQVQRWRREKKEALIKGEYDKLPELARAYKKVLPSTGSGSTMISGSTTSSGDNTTGWLSLPKPPIIKEFLGNIELLKLSKIAFLCSRNIPAAAVLKCYDWAIAQREAGHCVISGFHSQIEKDVLHYLLKGNQPIIIALARSLKDKIEPELRKPLEQGRILIISPFNENVKRVTEQTAEIRNRMMIELADKITIGYASVGGKIEKLFHTTEKEIIRLV